MIFLGALASSDIMAQKGPSKQEIAKWKLEDEHASRWEFKDDGKMYSTYIGSDIVDVYRYTISSTPPRLSRRCNLKSRTTY